MLKNGSTTNISGLALTPGGLFSEVVICSQDIEDIRQLKYRFKCDLKSCVMESESPEPLESELHKKQESPVLSEQGCCLTVSCEPVVMECREKYRVRLISGIRPRCSMTQFFTITNEKERGRGESRE